MESSVVVKTFRLLEVFAGSDHDQSLNALTDAVGLAKPTVHRLLKLLGDIGYVKRTSVGHYRLTGKIQELALKPDDRQLLAAAQPVLADLHGQSGETVNLGVLRQGRTVYLHVIESVHPLRRIVEPQATDPFHCTALGRAIVAHLPPASGAALLNQSVALERRTPATVTEPDRLREILAEVRRDGYAVEHDQTDVGVTCVAAPVFRGEDVAAAISLSVPTARAIGQRLGELVDAVRTAAAAVSKRLGSPLAVSPLA
jgi:IclR family acetate operon transcriptional repressor/IclR family KDG regulon transcriptional repressor